MKISVRKVPSFALYGEQLPSQAAGRLHIEDIQSRSRRYLWEIAPHTHRNLYQCVFVARGPAAVNIDDAHSALEGPALAILPPGTVHAFSFTAATHGHVLTIAPASLFEAAASASRVAFEALFAVPHLLTLEAPSSLVARLSRLFEHLLEEFRCPESADSPVGIWLARSALWLMGQELRRRHALGQGAHRQHQCFWRFQSLLESHYLDHWPLSRYAQAAGLSEGRLNRLCQAQRGQSAFELVQERLALEARRRLTYVSIPVAQVAAELGFRDPAYFCRFFKRRVGLSPSAFRRRQEDLAHTHLRRATPDETPLSDANSSPRVRLRASG